MNRAEIKKTLTDLTAEIDTTADKKVASILQTLVNLVEILVEKNAALEEENQRLKDEINRLKGEQGQPKFRKKIHDNDNNHSSEEERNKKEGKKPRKPKFKKQGALKIDRQVICEIEKENLPKDAKFKGYQTRVLQDIKITTDNVEFKLALYYSPSQKKRFMAELPAGYQGQFGPGIRALVISLYRDSGMTELAIERFFKTFHIHIAKSTISVMITENHDIFHQEKEDIVNAGLKITPFQHIDDTGCRVNGKGHYTHILCNPYFTAYFTRPNKTRLTLLDILCRSELKFQLNHASYALMREFGLSDKRLIQLQNIISEGLLTADEMEHVLNQMFASPNKQLTNRRVIREAAAIIYYQQTESAIQYLMCDDAPQFNNIATHQVLCWIHEGRHYKKLNPVFMNHRSLLDIFIKRYWEYYDALLRYKENPCENKARELSAQFTSLFSTKTGYDALDERIALTYRKKEALLKVLKFPFLPLHNNPAELGARVQARMRDINLQTISLNGTKTKDTFATLVQTAKKLGVNFYSYCYDRITKNLNTPLLADLILEKTGLLASPI
jgi:uncharacterized protein (DUF4415 family)